MAVYKPNDAQLDAALHVDIPLPKAGDRRYDFESQPVFSPPSPVSFLPPGFSFRRQNKAYERINAEIASYSIESNNNSPSSVHGPPPEAFGGRSRKCSLRLVDSVAGVATLSTHVSELPAWDQSTTAGKAASKPQGAEYDLGGRIRTNHSLADFTSFREKPDRSTSPNSSSNDCLATATDPKTSYSVPGSFVERARPFGPAPNAISRPIGRQVTAVQPLIMDKTSGSSSSSGGSSSTSAFGSSSSSSSGSSFMTKFYANFAPDPKRELNIMAPLSS